MAGLPPRHSDVLGLTSDEIGLIGILKTSPGVSFYCAVRFRSHARVIWETKWMPFRVYAEALRPLISY